MIPAEERVLLLPIILISRRRKTHISVPVNHCFRAHYSLYFQIHLLFDLDAFALYFAPKSSKWQILVVLIFTKFLLPRHTEVLEKCQADAFRPIFRGDVWEAL
jgi:hypothetical protein